MYLSQINHHNTGDEQLKLSVKIICESQIKNILSQAKYFS